jgi:hypothetical protein
MNPQKGTKGARGGRQIDGFEVVEASRKMNFCNYKFKSYFELGVECLNSVLPAVQISALLTTPLTNRGS